MEEYFLENLGVNEDIFRIVILPLLIFLARICDVSINTIRIIFVMSGRKWISTVLGFFESLIWLMAIGQIFRHVDNIYSYIAYPAGFAMGIFVGMMIEEKLAYGKVVVRLITQNPVDSLLSYLDEKGWKHVLVNGESHAGPRYVLFTVIERENIQVLLDEFRVNVPDAFYTIESVKQAAETNLIAETGRSRSIGAWLGSIKRK